MGTHDKSLQLTAIPLRSMAAGELDRSADAVEPPVSSSEL